MSLMSQVPARVRVIEVGPRDGLQNEAVTATTGAKRAFVQALVDAGCMEIEAGSFVSPRAVPQLADADVLFPALPADPAVTYSALVPNERGLERAMDAGVRSIAVFTAASESFAHHNIHMSIDESITVFARMIDRARGAGMTVRGYISTAFGCPYEGHVPPEMVAAVAQRLADIGVAELSIGDTIGVATPNRVEQALDRLLARFPVSMLAMHFHDTHGTALANVLLALQAGIATFDAAAGGLGGCPYAPGASGNLATEDLIYMLDGMDIESGISFDGICRAARQICHTLGREPASKSYRAWYASLPAGT
jgi:isopropylmalate/homocitrate/citramalate synthase